MSQFQSTYINVVGDSHVRSFAYSPYFFPVFIGPGKKACFLNSEIAAQTTEKVLSCLGRLDLTHPVMMVLGEPDVRLGLEQIEEREITKVLDFAIESYEKLLAVIQERHTCQLIVFNVVPSIDSRRNEYASYYNRALKTAADRQKAVYIDVWNDVIDKSTGCVNLDYAAEHVHLNEQAAGLVLKKLAVRKIIPAGLSDFAPHGFYYHYRFLLNDHEVRIWGDCGVEEEVQAVDKGRRWLFARTESTRSILNDLLGYMTKRYGMSRLKQMSFAVMDCRDGWVVFELLRQGIVNVTGHDSDAHCINNARRIAGLQNQDEARFQLDGDASSPMDVDFADIALDLLFDPDSCSRKARMERVFLSNWECCVFLAGQGDDMEWFEKQGARIQSVGSVHQLAEDREAYQLIFAERINREAVVVD